MTIRIIKAGLPMKTERQVLCSRCFTEFTFEPQVDARLVSDGRDGDYYTLPCPGCSKPVTVAV